MRYVRCINNQGYEISLRQGAIYRVLPPEMGDGHLLRIMDETAREPGSEERGSTNSWICRRSTNLWKATIRHRPGNTQGNRALA